MSYKRFFALLLCLSFALAAFVGCGEKPDEENENGETAEETLPAQNEYDEAHYLALLAQVTDETVVRLYTDDFDGDGAFEAYALTARGAIPAREEASAHALRLWFMKESTEPQEVANGDFYPDADVWAFSDKKLFHLRSAAATSEVSTVYFAAEGRAYSYGDFGALLVRDDPEKNTFTAYVRSFDAQIDPETSIGVGATEKPYYLWFDGNFFCEYGGIPVREDQLRAANGADAILTTLHDAGFTIGTIFYRGNGTLQINLTQNSGGTVYQHNLTLLFADGDVSVLPVGEDAPDLSAPATFSYGGAYVPAILPSIASYPDKFPA